MFGLVTVCCGYVLFCVKLFRVNAGGQIGYGERCVDTRGGSTLHITFCPVEPSGPWDYDKVRAYIVFSFADVYVTYIFLKIF